MLKLDPFIEAWDLRELIRKGEIHPCEVAEFYLSRIARHNGALGAYMTVTEERAMDDAKRIASLKGKAASMPLYGIPYSLKDLTPTKDVVTTFGSRNYKTFLSSQDAVTAIRLREAGGILLGKTTLPEFGGRPTTEGGLCPTAKNPWNLEYNAGGSSGGAAAQVIAGLGPLADASDGGGSIRGPSSNCGVVGLKPSRGRITYAPFRGEGWGGFATSGPIARSVRDVALMLDVMAGPVIGDPYWAPPPDRPFVEAVLKVPKKLKLAAIAETKLGPVDADVGRVFESACELMRELGHSVELITLDPGGMLVEYARPLICAGITATQIAHREWVDPVVAELFHEGKKLSAVDYINLVKEMHNTARSIVEHLHVYDALLTPTMTKPAMRNGTFPSRPDRYLDELWTWIGFEFPFNATGQPAISVPAGFTNLGLPIGLQIVGRQNYEFELLALAAAYEAAAGWKEKKPALFID